jgi:uncharacterized protein
MSSNKLPMVIQPAQLCRKGVEGTLLSGEISISSLLNLEADLRKQALSPIRYQLHFYVDKDTKLAIKGEISGLFELICQRCMLPMEYPIKTEILVSPVNSDAEAKQLSSKYEPLLMTEGEVNLSEWIAEEIHLALPLVPRHDTDCISYGE